MQRKHNKDIVPIAKVLRKNMTKEEKHLWYDFLRMYPVRFSRQKVLGKYIADFYCAEAKLVIELDGSGHYTEKQLQYDELRTAFLSEYGLTVIRISNENIHKRFEGVCHYIDNLVRQSLSQQADTLRASPFVCCADISPHCGESPFTQRSLIEIPAFADGEHEVIVTVK